MIPLVGQATLAGDWPETGETVLLRVAEDAPAGGMALECFYRTDAPFPVAGSIGATPSSGALGPAIVFPPSLDHLSPQDIVAVNRRTGRTRVLYRRASPHNSLLVTERCDNYCLMCSQPPRNVNDDALVDEILALIPKLPKDLRELGFTGGEPTLRGERFINILESCRDHLPSSAVHVLSNGRGFSDRGYAERWATVQHPDLMVGIPVYSDQSHIHDFVVQADGAFDQTIRGILNLKSLHQRVEIRIVLHRHTVGRLTRFAEFVSRNLSFVDHVALMGLELMGFAVAHQDDLWIHAKDHAEAIADAVEILSLSGLRTSIYNIPLCLLNERARPFAVQSISDWKREYWPQCSGCALKEQCGGAFFSSRARLAREIAPLQ
jgi:His-Xaa-Ser system radical SAM maturase HxsC